MPVADFWCKSNIGTRKKQQQSISVFFYAIFQGFLVTTKTSEMAKGWVRPPPAACQKSSAGLKYLRAQGLDLFEVHAKFTVRTVTSDTDIWGKSPVR